MIRFLCGWAVLVLSADEPFRVFRGAFLLRNCPAARARDYEPVSPFHTKE
jgi:hypothetical protein